ncbi:hypothetical protein [Sorangium sp. So ce128]|uniref:hypothetical protein n=1 Tax=Sorangium sp. So ce128 TaxID=3133281 RepID=UPI003F626C25
MLIVRAEQLRALAAAREARFMRELEAHVRRHFPAVAEAQSPSALQASLRAAVARATAHGLESPEDLCLYANIGAVLGWEFEATPQHAWIGELLRDASIASTSHRLRLAVNEVGRRLSLEEQNRVTEQQFKATAQARAGST